MKANLDIAKKDASKKIATAWNWTGVFRNTT
jgi:hypothetical protein